MFRKLGLSKIPHDRVRVKNEIQDLYQRVIMIRGVGGAPRGPLRVSVQSPCSPFPTLGVSVVLCVVPSFHPPLPGSGGWNISTRKNVSRCETRVVNNGNMSIRRYVDLR